MKVWMYKGGMKIVEKSGVGRAYEHQKLALKERGIPFVTKFSLDFDVIQLNTIFPDSFFATLLGKLMKKKVVYYAHSTMEDFRKSFKGSDFFAPLFKKWIMLCYQMGDIIITPTQYSRELLLNYGIKTEIVSLSNGIDLNFYHQDKKLGENFREKYQYKDSDKVIMSVGHYIERKGIEDFAELAKRMPEFQFLWFGYTNMNLIPDKIRKIIQLNLPNLHFPGYISREELREAYCGSDLFLFMTHEETEGIVLLEALATKIPILLRDIPIYEKWLEDKKQVYKARSMEDFENSIREIVAGQVPLLTEEGYLVAYERNINGIGNELFEIYSSLLVTQTEIHLV